MTYHPDLIAQVGAERRRDQERAARMGRRTRRAARQAQTPAVAPDRIVRLPETAEHAAEVEVA